MNLWELLTSTAVQDFIKESIKKKMDALQISTALNKAGYSNEERAAIMDYAALVAKFREKFSSKDDNTFLLCDKLALEQSTAQDIGRWKANLWKKLHERFQNNSRVHDLCCGMGGDSFYLPECFKVTGVDLDENRLAMYAYNIPTMRKGCTGNVLQADVREIAKQNCADYFTIDPARRAIEGENQRDLRNLTPAFEEVIEISKHYKGGMVKLPPGYPTDEIPSNTELVYLGSHSDCRELLVLFGNLAEYPGRVRAVMVNASGETVAEWAGNLNEIQSTSNRNAEKDLPGCERSFRNATSDTDLPVGEMTNYISEPTALLIRSHLFASVAKNIDAGAHLISEGIAYVASDGPLPSPGFASFEILDKTEIATSSVRKMLKSHDIGKITLKLRGVKLDPDAEIKRLKPKGKNSAILFYTRAAGEKIAILTKRV